MSLENEIVADLLHKEISKQKGINTRDIYSGFFCRRYGRYTMVPHYMTDCLMYILEDSPKTSWKLILFLLRNITGRPHKQKRRYYFLYESARKFMAKANIKGTKSFYTAIENLEDKKIIYFKEKKLFVNFFPLTWETEDLIVREKIKEIIEFEIEKVKEKGGKKND